MINHCMSEYDLQTVITNVHHACGGIFVGVRGSSANQPTSCYPRANIEGSTYFSTADIATYQLCRLVEQVSRLIRYALRSEKRGCKIPLILMNEN